MKHYLVPTRPIDDSFDRQNLAILKKRFLALNGDRLERMHQALAPRHRLFLDALPILFHCNHPMLPGFIARKTPCKISGFKPGKQDIEFGRAVARSFTLNLEPDIDEEIFGLYVMGSVGTVAQSDDSDLDIWVCHHPQLQEERAHQLQQKCDAISAWANSRGLEVHFFLMNNEAFLRGEVAGLNQESSGSAQRKLLLDEFYRSAIFIAGRIPLWWFVPDKNEGDYARYAETLLGKKYINDNGVIDFGSLADIPGGEFIGACVWQLYKAIEAPYKSVLKLLLLETYASEFPNTQPIALDYKRRIYAGEMNIDDLDAYILIYRRIEKYLLERRQHARLELARRCFYFKVNRRLTRSKRSSYRPWQRELIQQLVAEWGWIQSDLDSLDKHQQWKTEQVLDERSQLVSELNNSYRILLEFAQSENNNRAISSEELTVLGRKLQAAFERRPGKIEWINPHISDDLSEEVLSVVEQEENGQTTWFCYSPRNREKALKSASSLVELLLWAYFNGIIGMQTPLDMSQSSSVSNSETKRLLSVLDQWLPPEHESANHEQFLQAARPSSCLLVLNIGAPGKRSNPTKVQIIGNNSDALRFGGEEENLVYSADLISRNNWNELYVRRFDSDNALLNALEEYLQLSLPGTHHTAPELRIECINSDNASLIAHRTREWFTQIIQCFYGHPNQNSRYLFQLAKRFYCLQFKGARPSFTAYTSEEALLESLSAENEKFSPIVVDNRALRNTALPLICSRVNKGNISVFYRRFDIGMEMYIADEKGSISYERYRGLSNFNPLVPMHRFLRATIHRQALLYPEFVKDFDILPVYFFELMRRPGEALHAQQRQVSQTFQQAALFEVKAVAHAAHDKMIRYDFACDQQEFTHQGFGEQLFLVVAQYILSRRNAQENYPIYITDLDLSSCAGEIGHGQPLQITHYLKVKNFLEFKLNQAIGILLRA